MHCRRFPVIIFAMPIATGIDETIRSRFQRLPPVAGTGGLSGKRERGKRMTYLPCEERLFLNLSRGNNLLTGKDGPRDRVDVFVFEITDKVALARDDQKPSQGNSKTP